MAIKKIKVKFDVFFEELIDWDDEIDEFLVIPKHMEKKYNIKIKYSDIGLEDAYEIDEEREIT